MAGEVVRWAKASGFRNAKKRKSEIINSVAQHSHGHLVSGVSSQRRNIKKSAFFGLVSFFAFTLNNKATTKGKEKKKKNGIGRRTHDGSRPQNERTPPTLLSALWNSFLFSPFKDQQLQHTGHSSFLHQFFKSPTVQRPQDITTKPQWPDTSVSYPSSGSITTNKRTPHQPRRFLENYPTCSVLLVSSRIIILRTTRLSPPSSTSAPNPGRLLSRQHNHLTRTPPTLDRTTIPHAASPSQQEIRLLHRFCGYWKVRPPPTTHRKPQGTLQAGSGCCYGFNGDCGL